jgi:hypothetical protein
VKINRCYPAAIVQAAFLTIVSARAQDTTTDGYVTRKEYDELKAELLAIKKEQELRSETAPKVGRLPARLQSKRGPESQAVGDLHKEVTSGVSRPVADSGSLLGVHHMRLRANITGQEQRILKIREVKVVRSERRIDDNECQVPGRQK